MSGSEWSPGDVQRCFIQRAIRADPNVSAYIRRLSVSKPARVQRGRRAMHVQFQESTFTNVHQSTTR